jgi:hypothetical protein
MSLLVEEFYEAQGVFARKDESGDLLVFCRAWMLGLERVYEIVRDREDGRPGWAIALDPDECDEGGLDYLGQYPGAILTPEMSTAQRRAEIKAPTTWRRGQTETMRTAIRRTLTGAKKVIIRERTPEAHDIYVRTLKSETPDEARTEAVARANKLAGLVMDYEALDGVAWADVAAGWDDWGAVSAEFPTWADLADLLPDELPEP